MNRAFLKEHYSANHGEFLKLVTTLTGEIKHKKVLDIGCDYACSLSRELIFNKQAAEAIGVNPVFEPFAINSSIRLERQDAADLDFPDHYFDLIISSSAFEHVQNLSEVLQESWRVLKPGGYLYSHFGPIWSGAFGHHLWTQIGTETYTYHNVKLPPYCHLTMDFVQIMEYCIQQFQLSAQVSQQIAQYVLFSKEQNQLMFEDYEKLIFDSPFEVRLFSGYAGGDLGQDYLHRTTPNLFAELRQRYPRNHAFLYNGIQCLLYKLPNKTTIPKDFTQEALSNLTEKINYYRSPNLSPTVPNQAQIAVFPCDTFSEQIDFTHLKSLSNLEQIWVKSKKAFDLTTKEFPTIQTSIVPAFFNKSPQKPDIKAIIGFEESKEYRLLAVLETASQTEWIKLFSELLELPDENLFSISVICTSLSDLDWLEKMSENKSLDINIIEISSKTYKDIDLIIDQVDALLCPQLNLDLLANYFFLRILSTYTPILTSSYETPFALMEVQNTNMLKAFKLFHILNQRLPHMHLLQLNHRFIRNWNSNLLNQVNQLLHSSSNSPII